MKRFRITRKTIGHTLKVIIMRRVFVASFLLFGLPQWAGALDDSSKQKLTIQDVLDIQRLDRATLSPDGDWVAVVIQRPARAGEVYGRNSYEIDPSRSDIVLVSTKTGERRAITSGAERAAGFWCATWSPDGQKLAMLSTQPDESEPRGGNNVRVYVWERASGQLIRSTQEGVPTQMRYGGPWQRLDFRGGIGGGTATHKCSEGEENAPFLWLDNERLLVATLPPGQTSALLDRYARPSRVGSKDFQNIQGGEIATGRAAGSGLATQSADEVENKMILKSVDAGNGKTQSISSVPTHPFRGTLTVTVAPDGRHLSILTSVKTLEPREGSSFPNTQDDNWTVENRFGFVKIAPNSDVEWVKLPKAVRFALALYEWSPDSKHVVLRGRGDQFSDKTSLFVVPAGRGKIAQLTSQLKEAHRFEDSFPVLWTDARHVIARLPGPADNARNDWWQIDLAGRRVNVTKQLPLPPSAFQRGQSGELLALASDTLLKFDPKSRAMLEVTKVQKGYSLSWPRDNGLPTDKFLMSRENDRVTYLQSMTTGGKPGPDIKAPSGNILDLNTKKQTVLTLKRDNDGDILRSTNMDAQTSQDVIHLNNHLAKRRWGQKQLIEYNGFGGKPRKAVVILPPDYQPGRRYPTLLWVYWGYEVRSLDGDYSTDRFMPGFYNLHLYAAQGYVVVVPSMPAPPSADTKDSLLNLSADVLPAVDHLIKAGITDENRVGIFGQSSGGYTVAALLTQTDRFKAGVAIAGLTDLSSFAGEFDPMAKGYPGIEHEKSVNADISRRFGLSGSPSKDVESYALLSPLTYVDRVKTPLLLLHGDLDIRGSSTQAERFFQAMYSSGQTAQIVRYGGESHSIAQSPANIRDVFSRTIEWFNKYLD